MGVKRQLMICTYWENPKDFSVCINMSTLLKWKCSKGHVWEVKTNGISN